MPHDLVQTADAVIHLITAVELDGLIERACPATWAQAGGCLRSPDPSEQLLGYRLALTALAETPEGARMLIERLALALAGHAWA